MNTNQKIILNLYYEEHLSIIEVANRLNISKQYVSRIVRKDLRHPEETKQRKEINRLKQIERNKQYIKNKRNRDKQLRINGIVELLHNQAISELSGRKSINNRAYRDWNSSIYKYNYRTKEYRVKKEFKNHISYAVPKKIKWG